MARPEDATTIDLLKSILDDSKQLARLEVALAKDEAVRDLEALRAPAIAFGVAAVAGICALSLLLVAVALAIAPGPLPPLILGVVLAVVGGVSALVGYRLVPAKRMEGTKRRVQGYLAGLEKKGP